MIQIGSIVILNVPENTRLHESTGVVKRIAEWGAHVSVSSASTGEFRALWEEMEETIDSAVISTNGVIINGVHPPPKKMGYTGNICNHCGGARMVRNGVCEVCQDCGSTSGCS